MFSACGMNQRALMRIVVTALLLSLVSGCGGGGGGQEEEQASEDTLKSQDALNAALEQSFLLRERCAGGGRRCPDA
jgi:hypothetical protein